MDGSSFFRVENLDGCGYFCTHAGSWDLILPYIFHVFSSDDIVWVQIKCPKILENSGAEIRTTVPTQNVVKRGHYVRTFCMFSRIGLILSITKMVHSGSSMTILFDNIISIGKLAMRAFQWIHYCRTKT